MQHYVLGFLFDIRNKNRIILILKKKGWQKGMWNGIGGKIEKGELPIEAMRRECLEETGLAIKKWQHTVVVTGDEYKLFVYYAFAKLTEVSLCTDAGELSEIHLVSSLPVRLVPKVNWLLNMQLENLEWPLYINEK